MKETAAKIASALRKWLSGDALDGEHRSALAEVLPASCIELGPRRPRTYARYPERLQNYAERYGYTARALKGWIEIGREAKPEELPPLDDPAALVGWWSRHMKQRVPVRLLEIAQGAGAAAPRPPAATPAAPASSSAAVSMPAPGLSTGLLASLERARGEEAAAYQALAAAQRETPPNLATIEMRRRAWESIFEALRRAESSAADTLKATGDLLPKSEVRRDLQEIHSTIYEQLRALVRRLRPRLAVAATPAEQDAVWDRGLDECFSGLRQTRFGPVQPFQLSA